MKFDIWQNIVSMYLPNGQTKVGIDEKHFQKDQRYSDQTAIDFSHRHFLNAAKERKCGQTKGRYVRLVDGPDFIEFAKYYNAIIAQADLSIIESIISSSSFVQILQQLIQYPVLFSPLHRAIVSGREDVVQILLRYGAKPNAHEIGSNIRAIHLAVIYKLKNAVKALVSHGADLSLSATMINNSIVYKGNAKEMAVAGPSSPKGVEILEILEGENNVKRDIKKSMQARLTGELIEIKHEIRQAKQVHGRLDEVESEIKNLDFVYESMDWFQLECFWAKVNMEKTNRPRAYIKHLEAKQKAIEEILNEDQERTESKSFLMCPVCYDIPSGSVFNCQKCFNHVCSNCKLRLEDQKCPCCRVELRTSPLIENRTLQIIISRSEKS